MLKLPILFRGALKAPPSCRVKKVSLLVLCLFKKLNKRSKVRYWIKFLSFYKSLIEVFFTTKVVTTNLTLLNRFWNLFKISSYQLCAWNEDEQFQGKKCMFLMILSLLQLSTQFNGQLKSFYSFKNFMKMEPESKPELTTAPSGDNSREKTL